VSVEWLLAMPLLLGVAALVKSRAALPLTDSNNPTEEIC
jgi:hypothetical protein